MRDVSTPTRPSVRRHLLVGALVLLAGPLSLAVWAATYALAFARPLATMNLRAGN